MRAGRWFVAAVTLLLTVAVHGPTATADGGSFADPAPAPRLSSPDRDVTSEGAAPDDSGQESVAITVSPDLDLLDGQVVTVTASGFVGVEDVLVAECVVGTSSPESECGNVIGTATDASGELVLEYQLAAVLEPFAAARTPGRAAGSEGAGIDCRAVACELWVAVAGDIFRRGTAALDFDPDGPLRPEMALTVTPRDHLVDGQVVDVGISGFTPDGPVDVVECSLSSDLSGTGCAADAVQSLTTDSFGALHTTYAVALRFDSADGPVDCRSQDCILVAVDRSVPIDFGQGYLFEFLDFTDAVTPPDLPEPAPPTPITPHFTG